MSEEYLKFEQWSQADAEKELPLRLKAALEHRQLYETRWRANEKMLFGDQASAPGDSEVSVSYQSLAELFAGDLSSGDSWISVNYMFKYLRYIHSQMCANPPSVLPRPTSSDYSDRRSAECADNLVTYGRRHYGIQDKVDLTSLQTLSYGSGFMKVCWDATGGEPLKVKKSEQKILMTGDAQFKSLLIWDIALDHTARCWSDVRYLFERHLITVEEAKYRWPKHGDKFENYAAQKGKTRFWDKDEFGHPYSGRIEVWEYTEKGLPWNGMAGRRCFMLEDGTLLSDLAVNPNPGAKLPYFCLTDIDVPGQVYGKTFIDYLIRIQDVLNRLDSTVLDNVQAHGVVRMVVYDAAENPEEVPGNGAWEVLNLKGAAGQKPDFINPPTLMPDLYRFREQLVAAMEQIAGVNESMFGQVNREMSGFSIQTAINAGNMVRRRLYNKYEHFVEGIYLAFLELIQQEWSDERKVLVTGEENALSVAYYSGADIASGWDLDVQYGASFSLDPASRREEIMQMMPFLKEAGFSMKSILRMLRLNDIPSLFDLATMSQRRQLEIIDEMVAKYDEKGLLVYVAPEEGEEHAGMLEAAYNFRMSMAFKVLDSEVKELIKRHITEREQLAAQDAAPGPGGAAPGAMPPAMAGGAAPGGLPGPAAGLLGPLGGGEG